MRPAVVALGCILAMGAGCAPGQADGPEQVLERFAAEGSFNGVIVVANDDAIVADRQLGFADVEAQRPSRLDTRYQLGSVAKWITTLVVYRLVDQGLLSLDEPIASYLPGHRTDIAAHVTLHHLLSHTSGVPNHLVAAYQSDPANLSLPLSTEEAVARFASGGPRFTPGTEFDYSHSNWILVQAIVERVTGEPFEAVLQREIVAPLGLDDTGTFATGTAAMATLAPGYESLAPEPVRADLPAPRWLTCAGGMYSSAADLLRLAHAVYGGDLLSESSRERLDTVVWREDDLSLGERGGGYAHGGRVRAMDLDGEEMVLWHTGSNGPSKVRISRVLSTGFTVITMANDDTDHDRTGDLIEALLAVR